MDTCFALSVVRDKVKEIVHPNQIHNYKSFLIKKAGWRYPILSINTEKWIFDVFFQSIYQRMILPEKYYQQTSSKKLHIYYMRKSRLVLLVSKKSIVMQLIYKTDTWTNGKMQKHFLQHYLSLIEFPSTWTTRTRKKLTQMTWFLIMILILMTKRLIPRVER